MTTANVSRFTKVRAVTLPVLKFELAQARNIAILGAMYKGKKIDDKKEAATLCHALDMDSGEEGLMICATVLEKELNENYPGESYVGKGFEIIKHRDAEKKYNHYSICELGLPEDVEAAVHAMMRQNAKAAKAERTAAKAGK